VDVFWTQCRNASPDRCAALDPPLTVTYQYTLWAIKTCHWAFHYYNSSVLSNFFTIFMPMEIGLNILYSLLIVIGSVMPSQVYHILHVTKLQLPKCYLQFETTVIYRFLGCVRSKQPFATLAESGLMFAFSDSCLDILLSVFRQKKLFTFPQTFSKSKFYVRNSAYLVLNSNKVMWDSYDVIKPLIAYIAGYSFLIPVSNGIKVVKINSEESGLKLSSPNSCLEIV